VTLGAASIACILGGHNMLQKRNVALVAAYKGLESTFSEYRKRVIAELGEEEERDLYFDIKREVVEDEDGEEKTVYHTKGGISPYGRPFDETNNNWEKNAGANWLFLKNQQNMMNDRLHARGHVFLNEVYDRLGFPRTSEGAVVGWLRFGDGDGNVDFGMFDFEGLHGEGRKLFLNGEEDSVWLDFNVDGIIYDKI
jgi:hypothetical protein